MTNTRLALLLRLTSATIQPLFCVLFLAYCLAACQSKTETPASDFDIDLLTRKEGWVIQQALSDSLTDRMALTNFEKMKDIEKRFSQDSLFTKFAYGIVSMNVFTAMMRPRLDGKQRSDAKRAPPSIVRFVKVSDNQVRAINLSQQAKDSAIIYNLITIAGKKALDVPISAKTEDKNEAYSVFEQLTSERLSVLNAIYYVPKDSLSRNNKPTESERLWGVNRLELTPNNP